MKNNTVISRGTARRAPTGEQFGKPTIGTIPTIIRSFKSAVTKRINELSGLPGIPLWQRNFYDHIIRNENSMNEIRECIRHNPMHWERDELNPFNNNRKNKMR